MGRCCLWIDVQNVWIGVQDVPPSLCRYPTDVNDEKFSNGGSRAVPMSCSYCQKRLLDQLFGQNGEGPVFDADLQFKRERAVWVMTSSCPCATYVRLAIMHGDRQTFERPRHTPHLAGSTKEEEKLFARSR